MNKIQDDWSNLCTDLLRLILESLSTSDFHRARTICSNWYFLSKTCVRSLYPWRIIFGDNESLLFDPIEDKIYRKPLLGIDFSSMHCLAISGNWLFIVDHCLDLYLLNVFTRERINLPSLESLCNGIEGNETNIIRNKEKAAFSMNEKTKDYVVAWAYKDKLLFSYKKGDYEWQNTNLHDDDDNEGKAKCLDMAFKDNKLYVYTFGNYIKIYDFSTEFPKEVVEGNPYLNRQFRTKTSSRITISNSGEVLIIRSPRRLPRCSFYVFKMNMKNGEWESINSLGDEILIYGHGVTLRTSVNSSGGFKSDSICFVEDDFWPSSDDSLHLRKTNCGVFNLATGSVIWGNQIGFMKPTRWFIPKVCA